MEVNFINSNAINPTDYTKYDMGEADIPLKPQITLLEVGDKINIPEEQAKDPEIAQTLRLLQLGQAKKTVGDKHLVMDDVLYYLTDSDNDPIRRLYVSLRISPDLSNNIVMTMDILGLKKLLTQSGRNITGQIFTRNFITM